MTTDSTASFAYVASSEFGLSVVDIRDPAQPVTISAASLPFYGQQIAVSGTIAVVNGPAGLTVVDISNPAAPQTLGTLSGNFFGVATDGTHAYSILSAQSGNPPPVSLAVIDLHVPSAPALAGQVTIGSGGGLALAGSNVYIAVSGGLKVVDVSTPTAPTIAASVTIVGGAQTIALDGAYAYLGSRTGITAVNISSPHQPAFVSTVSIPATALAVSGNNLLALANGQLEILDITNQSVPSLKRVTNSFSAQGLGATSNLALLASPTTNASTGAGGLYLIDISIPSSPQEIANVFDGFDNGAVAVSGPRAVVATSSLGLRLLDLSNPSTPHIIGSIGGAIQAVAMSGNFVYSLLFISGNPGHYDLTITDFTAPANPVGLSEITVGSSASRIAVSGAYAYVAANTGLEIIDVSDPSAPQIRTTVAPPAGSTAPAALALGVGYAYLGSSTNLWTVDIHTPTAPALLPGVVALSVSDLAVSGNRLYALSSTQVSIFDMTFPQTPSSIGSSSNYSGQALAVTGTTVLLATPALTHIDPTGGIYVVDASIPNQPLLVAKVIVPGATRSLTTANGIVYAGDSAATLDIITLTP